VALKVQINS